MTVRPPILPVALESRVASAVIMRGRIKNLRMFMKSSPGKPINMMAVAFFSGSLIALTGSFTAAPTANPMTTPTIRITRSKSLRRRRKTAPQHDRKRSPCPFVPRPIVSTRLLLQDWRHLGRTQFSYNVRLLFPAKQQQKQFFAHF